MTNRTDVLEVYCKLCREKGATLDVGPEYYRRFSDLDDSEMEDLLVELALANAETINKMVFAQPRKASDQDLVDFMEMMMNLTFSGFIVINADGGLGCTAPRGPLPTDIEEAALDHRIRSAFPLVGPAIIRAAGGTRQTCPSPRRRL